MSRTSIVQHSSISFSMEKVGASPSQSALSAVDATLADYPLRFLQLAEIECKYHFHQAIVANEYKHMEDLNLQKDDAEKRDDLPEVQRLEIQIEQSRNSFLEHNHRINMLFSHGPPKRCLIGRNDSLKSIFGYIGKLFFSNAREVLYELLTSVYFREVAIFVLTLMALCGQFNDQDTREICIEKVDKDLAAAWASKLTESRLQVMYKEATCMNFDDLWAYQFRGIWDVLE